MSVRHPSSETLTNPVSGLWSRILWFLMPQKTRRALKDVVAENVKLIREQDDQQRYFIDSRRAICDLSDRHEARANELQKKLDWIGPMNTALADAHTELVLEKKTLLDRALPQFNEVVTTAIP